MQGTHLFTRNKIEIRTGKHSIPLAFFFKAKSQTISVNIHLDNIASSVLSTIYRNSCSYKNKDSFQFYFDFYEFSS